MKHHTKTFQQLQFTSIILTLIGLFTFTPAQAEEAIVHAVLFYSPTCGHCQKVIQQDLPPLVEKYGDQLVIIGIDVTQEAGRNLYQAAIEHLEIPRHRLGVPMLIVGDQILLGSIDIPEKFPDLIETYLAQGGVEWPDIPGLAEMIAAEDAQATPSQTTPPGKTEPPTATGTSSSETATSTVIQPKTTATEAQPTVPPTETPEPANPSPSAPPVGLVIVEDEPGEPLTLEEKLARDPVGNGMAIVVLAGMVIILIMAAWVLRRPTSRRPSTGHKWAFALLWLVGFGVAGYMAYVETAQVSAVCGPVGDCNTVQQSEYARLFGVLPIGVIGLFGYGAIFLAWVISNVQHKRLSELATLALAAMTFFGTLFSIYLTFLEPFVIGATCVWCLTSAVVMTALFVLSIPYFRSRWSHILTNT